MHLDRALAQLSEIHAQVLHSAIYRGYSARTCLLTAALALAGAAVQGAVFPQLAPEGFALYWSGLALSCASLFVLDVLRGRGACAESFGRTLTVVSQLLPALLVGAALPWVLLRLGPDGSALLPGLWAAVFGLGVLASRPYLPRAIGWVGLFYLLAGGVLLGSAQPGAPSPWSVGMVFAIGQVGAAAVLWFQLERRA
jgi:hypothetical protein